MDMASAMSVGMPRPGGCNNYNAREGHTVATRRLQCIDEDGRYGMVCVELEEGWTHNGLLSRL